MSMNILALERNYIPLDIDTRFHACSRKVFSAWPIRKILSFYHIKRSSLYRWLKRFDGTKESLLDLSHRPHSDHPNKLKKEIVDRILNLHRRNPDQSFVEIWVRLKHEGISVCPSSVLRTFKRNNEYIKYRPNPKKHDKKYHTPKMVHVKWQVDVKYVPKECKAGNLEGKYYQYTILDECSRKRVLYFTEEHSMYNTVQALLFAREKFGCFPLEIQTDNGVEFTDERRKKSKGVNLRKCDNLVNRFCSENNIKHHLIRPRTPQHNGKVERSHRLDQDKFYRTLKFYSLNDLRTQGAAWNKRYNNMPKMVLGFKTPNEVELEKLKELQETTGEIRCLKSATSFDT